VQDRGGAIAINNIASMARIDRLTLAIGEDRFGEALFQTMQAAGDIHHCMVAVKGGRAAPRIRVNVGAAPTAACGHLIKSYEGGLHHEDAACPAGGWDGAEGPHWVRPLLAKQTGAALREAWRACGVSDLTVLRGGFTGGGFSIQLFRLGGSTFLDSQLWLMEQIGELVAANVAKHLANLRSSGVGRSYVIGRILRGARFAGITERERSVCIGILTGYTSESIALNLGISVNSVLTYRKRLYEKLKISSQSELFVLVMQAANDPPLHDGAPATEFDGDDEPGPEILAAEA
jgi:DNA-binding CsgD family transcriptional regulator